MTVRNAQKVGSLAPDDVINVAALTIISAFAGSNVGNMPDTIATALLIVVGITGLSMQAVMSFAIQKINIDWSEKTIGLFFMLVVFSTINGLGLSLLTDRVYLGYGLSYGWLAASALLRLYNYTGRMEP